MSDRHNCTIIKINRRRPIRIRRRPFILNDEGYRVINDLLNILKNQADSIDSRIFDYEEYHNLVMNVIEFNSFYKRQLIAIINNMDNLSLHLRLVQEFPDLIQSLYEIYNDGSRSDQRTAIMRLVNRLTRTDRPREIYDRFEALFINGNSEVDNYLFDIVDECHIPLEDPKELSALVVEDLGHVDQNIRLTEEEIRSNDEEISIMKRFLTEPPLVDIRDVVYRLVRAGRGDYNIWM